MNKYAYLCKLAGFSGIVLFLTSGHLTAKAYELVESREFPAGDFDRISVNTGSGDVIVTNVDGDSILIDVTLSVRSSSEEKADKAFEQTKIDFSEVDRNLKVEVDQPGQSGFSLFGLGKLSPDVVVDIKCPPGIHLDVKTGSGDVVANNITGDFKAGTGSGDVVAQKVAGKLDVDTGSGDVIVKHLEGILKAGTGSGDVSAEGAIPSFSVDTGSGDVQIDSSVQIDAKSDADTGSGDVDILLPGSSSFQLKASTGSGAIRLNFLEAGVVNAEDSLEMPVNGSGPLLRIRTGSGDVSVRARD
jgi:DUF4097 and DUF4098 domain-containing protein YvlB